MKSTLPPALRRRLFGLAYRMLGSRADAEDIVQEAQIRLHEHRDDVAEVDRFLFRVAARLCIDRLRHERVKRAAYVGPWLPEPLATPDPERLAELGDELALGFMLLLERLTPDERVVYVLREAFDFSFAEIAEVVGTSAATCRQRLRRGKARLAGRVVAAAADADVKPLLERLSASLTAGRVDDLVELLADDAVLVTDGGGRVPAALVPVTGSARIATILTHLARRLLAEGAVDFAFSSINGELGILLYLGGELYAAVSVAVAGGLIQEILVVRNPDKLGALDRPV